MTLRLSPSAALAYLPHGTVAPSRNKFNARVRSDDPVTFHCRAMGLPLPVLEHPFHPTRKWRFDWAWPDLMVALEQEGVVYPTAKGDHRLSGRHVSVKGFKEDVEKYAEAFRIGWRVLRVMPEHITSGQAVLWLESALRVA